MSLSFLDNGEFDSVKFQIDWGEAQRNWTGKKCEDAQLLIEEYKRMTTAPSQFTENPDFVNSTKCNRDNQNLENAVIKIKELKANLTTVESKYIATDSAFRQCMQENGLTDWTEEKASEVAKLSVNQLLHFKQIASSQTTALQIPTLPLYFSDEEEIYLIMKHSY